MRKLSYAAIAVLLAVWFICAGPASAAWDCADVLDVYQPGYLKSNRGTMRVKVSCTSDAGGDTYTLTNQDIKGAYFVALETDPDGTDVPAGVYTATITNDKGTTILTAANRSTTANEIMPASQTIGAYVPMFQTKITSTTLGNTKKTVFYLYFDIP